MSFVTEASPNAFDKRKGEFASLPILWFLFELPPPAPAAKSLPKWETFEFDLAMAAPLLPPHYNSIGLHISHCIPHGR